MLVTDRNMHPSHQPVPCGCVQSPAPPPCSRPQQCVTVPCCKPVCHPPRPPKLCQTRTTHPCPPPVPCPPEECKPTCASHNGYLLPRIVASGREWNRRACVRLCLSGLSECAEPPYTLVSVAAAPQQPSWEMQPQPSPGRLLLHVAVPLVCQVRDRCGAVYTATATLESDVCLRLACSPAECWRNALMVMPCVRLCSIPCNSDDCCFDAQLEVLIDAYMTRWEPCKPQPACQSCGKPPRPQP